MKTRNLNLTFFISNFEQLAVKSPLGSPVDSDRLFRGHPQLLKPHRQRQLHGDAPATTATRIPSPRRRNPCYRDNVASARLPGRPELPFITVIFVRLVLWRLAVLGSQETEHVKYTPSEIRHTSRCVTAGGCLLGLHARVHTLPLHWLWIVWIFDFSNLWLISARADPWGLMEGSSGSSGLWKRKR